MLSTSGFFNHEYLFKKLISITLVVILCLGLIFISKLILKDVTGWIDKPKTQSMITLNNLLQEKEKLNAQSNKSKTALEAATRQYKSEIESYENWLKARTALGRPKEDKKILSKLKKLEGYRNQTSKLQRKLDNITKIATELNKKIFDARQKLHTEAAKDEKFREDLQKYSLKIFIIRLLYLMPIFAIGMILVLDKRKHVYWPISWSLIVFSIYMFYWDVVPYIPDFGFFRYIHQTGGLLFASIVGYLVLVKINQTLVKKKQRLQLPLEQRAKQISGEQAFKSYARHSCPSCEKDFLYRKWNIHSYYNRKTITESLAPDFCVYCGLQLFVHCEPCQVRHFAYLPSCPACGHIQEDDGPPTTLKKSK